MLRDKIVGTWRLVSYVAQDDRGGAASYPLGPDAVGLIMYTTDGYMSAQLMRPGRPGYDQPDTSGATTQTWCPSRSFCTSPRSACCWQTGGVLGMNIRPSPRRR